MARQRVPRIVITAALILGSAAAQTAEFESLNPRKDVTEHWVIVAGRARVTRGDAVLDLDPGAHVHIPVETAHRIENPGTETVEFIEVQQGEKLDEADIVRLEDRYGRG